MGWDSIRYGIMGLFALAILGAKSTGDMSGFFGVLFLAFALACIGLVWFVVMMFFLGADDSDGQAIWTIVYFSCVAFGIYLVWEM